MTCHAAAKAAFAAIADVGATAPAIFRRINWWTPETIQEALDLLVFEQRLARVQLKDGTLIYRRPGKQERTTA